MSCRQFDMLCGSEVLTSVILSLWITPNDRLDASARNHQRSPEVASDCFNSWMPHARRVAVKGIITKCFAFECSRVRIWTCTLAITFCSRLPQTHHVKTWQYRKIVTYCTRLRTMAFRKYRNNCKQKVPLWVVTQTQEHPEEDVRTVVQLTVRLYTRTWFTQTHGLIRQ